MVSGIYQIQNQINKRRYIGSAMNLNQRWSQHLSALRHGTHHNPHLQAAFRKYGESAFTFTILEDIADILQLIGREQYFLDTFLPEYNLSPTAGSSLGMRHSSETCRKNSEAKRGQRHPNFGKHLSAETREKIGAAQRGRHHTDETRAKLSKANSGERNPMYGKHHSEETRAKLSAAHKGKSPNAVARLKMSQAKRGARNHNYGKRLSEEHRRKISEAHRGEEHYNYGKRASRETRRKMSEAQRARRRRELAKALAMDRPQLEG